MLASYPEYQRDARSRGLPQLGAGAIYPIEDSAIMVTPFPVPSFWPRAYGLDVGWKRTAAVWGAVDREADTVYLYDEYYRGQQEPPVHAEAIKRRGEWMTGAIDPASRGRGQSDGSQLLVSYAELGLNLVPAINAVDAGLMDLYTRMSNGRLKVFSSLTNWWIEKRLYRRDEKGNIVKDRDHLMDATRYLEMSGLAVASVDPNYLSKMNLSSSHVSDYDPLAGADG